MEIERYLSLDNLNTSCFLFGCRQVGKTWLLKRTGGYDIYIDLLKKSELIRYTKNPELLYAEIEALNKRSPLIVIDEIQKAPGLLDEVHRLIESQWDPRFILTGSSARKLKRSHANMLGGRAITLRLFPFSYYEVKDLFSLNDFLHFGGLPNIFLAQTAQTKKKLLESYINTYLKEEIFDEALIRNLPAFSKFLDIAGYENGNVINYSNIAREVGVSLKVIREYFNILEDTLIGFYLLPYYGSHRKRIISHPKFYLNDTGLVFAIKRMLSIDFTEGTQLYGNAFEHFIILEVMKYISYLGEEINTWFFRTSDGAEVDLILEKHGSIIPVEIKSSQEPHGIAGLKSFLKDHAVLNAYCVCNTPRPYKINNILFIPWQDFIERLYTRSLFSN
ncbi:MAG: ATP-binding protein [bacterium]